MSNFFLYLIPFLTFSLFASEQGSILKQARDFFSSFESEEKPLTEQRSKEAAQIVQLMTKNMPENPSGQYVALLGDGHYYLGNFGQALYFWKRAERKLPYSQGLEKRIFKARSLLGLDRPSFERPIMDAIGLTFLPKTMKYTLLLASALVSLFFWTLWLFLNIHALRLIFTILFLFTCLLMGLVTWYEWFSPPRVMILRATELRGTLDLSSKLSHSTYSLKTGEEAEVESSSPDKKWLRIRTVGNQLGYVHGSAVGFLD
jgi:hypothetical protein